MKMQPEGKSHHIPAVLARHVLVSIWRMWKGNLNPEIRQNLPNPSGFLFTPCSHACKYSCYYSAEYFPDWEVKKLTNAPLLMVASGCIPLPHKSVDNDRFSTESPSMLFWCGPHNSRLSEWFIGENIIFVTGKNKLFTVYIFLHIYILI